MVKIEQTHPAYSHLFHRLGWKELDPAYLRQLISIAREEDQEGAGLIRLPRIPGDATTSLLEPEAKGRADLVARQEMLICGIELVAMILKTYGADATFRAQVQDGDKIAPGGVIGTLEGAVGTMLQAERIVLNFLQHLCGVATQTAQYVEALGWSQTRLLDTRKTTPGFRVLEKYAVACGGGWNHRIGLFDRVMLKDNHLAVSSHDGDTSWVDLVKRSRKKVPDLLVEIEVDRMEQIQLALEADADIIMLDNFSLADLAEAVNLIGDRAYTEASGGITLETLPELGRMGLDFISSGALIHQSTWMDIGLDWQE